MLKALLYVVFTVILNLFRYACANNQAILTRNALLSFRTRHEEKSFKKFNHALRSMFYEDTISPKLCKLPTYVNRMLAFLGRSCKVFQIIFLTYPN
ncbi:hypothetical protein GGR35_000224 [Mucilaginibacter phyllosphaerae]|uniref:Uncharacterized protein n=1 Tax=Mucilaginibacter phyllosphaerae TaxID=1812349 RepID=A0ABR6I3M5_9SPHI|nr:hypothetical protein [Mucilaginibacter phyllosphaerae]